MRRTANQSFQFLTRAVLLTESRRILSGRVQVHSKVYVLPREWEHMDFGLYYGHIVNIPSLSNGRLVTVQRSHYSFEHKSF